MRRATGTVLAIQRARAGQLQRWACPTKGCRYVLTANVPARCPDHHLLMRKAKRRG